MSAIYSHFRRILLGPFCVAPKSFKAVQFIGTTARIRVRVYPSRGMRFADDFQMEEEAFEFRQPGNISPHNEESKLLSTVSYFKSLQLYSKSFLKHILSKVKVPVFFFFVFSVLLKPSLSCPCHRALKKFQILFFRDALIATENPLNSADLLEQ